MGYSKRLRRDQQAEDLDFGVSRLSFADQRPTLRTDFAGRRGIWLWLAQIPDGHLRSGRHLLATVSFSRPRAR